MTGTTPWTRLAHSKFLASLADLNTDPTAHTRAVTEAGFQR